MLKALDNFFTHAAVIALTRSLLQGEIHVERKFAGMKVAGYGIEGQIDFVSVARPAVHILDWKMGLPVGDEQSLQLFTYGWWASLNFDIKPEAVAFQRIFLGDATVEPQRTLDPAVLRRGKARLVQDIELMKELDPYGREGNERAFSPCAKEKVCRQCKYQGTIRMAWMSGNTPSPAHSCSLRQQVLPEGMSKGIACQGEPVRSSQRMPSRHSRSSCRGRPPFGDAGCSGRCGAMRSQCSSVKTRLVCRMIGSFANHARCFHAKR